MLISPNGIKVEQALHYDFPATNSEAQHEALVARHKVA